jgi:predicted small lipoprotein YifL
MIGKRLLTGAVLLLIAIVPIIGCGHKDPLDEAAPPVSSDAHGLGNAAGTKPTAGSPSTGMGGGAGAAPATSKPLAKP